MRSFKWPPTLLPHCSQCFHRPISTTATATGKRRKDRSNNKRLEGDLQERASILRARIWEARVARREDWILGPLAPRRDTGTDNYGTMAARELRGVKGGLGVGILTQRASGGVTAAGKRGGKKGEGVGMSWKESLIYEGDRVAVLSGEGPESRELGRIGKVRNVRRAEREVLIDDFNLVSPIRLSWC